MSSLSFRMPSSTISFRLWVRLCSTEAHIEIHSTASLASALNAWSVMSGQLPHQCPALETSGCWTLSASLSRASDILRMEKV